MSPEIEMWGGGFGGGETLCWGKMVCYTHCILVLTCCSIPGERVKSGLLRQHKCLLIVIQRHWANRSIDLGAMTREET